MKVVILLIGKLMRMFYVDGFRLLMIFGLYNMRFVL